MTTPTSTPAAPELYRTEIRYDAEMRMEALYINDVLVGYSDTKTNADRALKILVADLEAEADAAWYAENEVTCEVCQQAVATWRIHTKDYIAFACDTCYTKHWANNEHNVNPWEADPTAA